MDTTGSITNSAAQPVQGMDTTGGARNNAEQPVDAMDATGGVAITAEHPDEEWAIVAHSAEQISDKLCW